MDNKSAGLARSDVGANRLCEPISTEFFHYSDKLRTVSMLHSRLQRYYYLLLESKYNILSYVLLEPLLLLFINSYIINSLGYIIIYMYHVMVCSNLNFYVSFLATKNI